MTYDMMDMLAKCEANARGLGLDTGNLRSIELPGTDVNGMRMTSSFPGHDKEGE